MRKREGDVKEKKGEEREKGERGDKARLLYMFSFLFLFLLLTLFRWMGEKYDGIRFCWVPAAKAMYPFIFSFLFSLLFYLDYLPLFLS